MWSQLVLSIKFSLLKTDFFHSFCFRVNLLFFSTNMQITEQRTQHRSIINKSIHLYNQSRMVQDRKYTPPFSFFFFSWQIVYVISGSDDITKSSFLPDDVIILLRPVWTDELWCHNFILINLQRATGHMLHDNVTCCDTKCIMGHSKTAQIKQIMTSY